MDNMSFFITASEKRKALLTTIFSLQLNSTKSVDGQSTLLHFLEDIIEAKYPEIAGFELELSHVEQAARGEWGNPWEGLRFKIFGGWGGVG